MTDTGTRSHNSPVIVDESLETHMTSLKYKKWDLWKEAGRRAWRLCMWDQKTEEKQSPGVATLCQDEDQSPARCTNFQLSWWTKTLDRETQTQCNDPILIRTETLCPFRVGLPDLDISAVPYLCPYSHRHNKRVTWVIELTEITYKNKEKEAVHGIILIR